MLTVNGIMLPTHAHTDGRGQYSVLLYRSGRYRVRVVATGFNVTESPEVYVSLGKDGVCRCCAAVRPIGAKSDGDRKRHSHTADADGRFDYRHRSALYPHASICRTPCAW